MESSIARQLNFPGVLAIGDFRICDIERLSRNTYSVSDLPFPYSGYFWELSSYS